MIKKMSQFIYWLAIFLILFLAHIFIGWTEPTPEVPEPLDNDEIVITWTF